MSPVASEQSGDVNLLVDDKCLLRRRQNEQLVVYLFVSAALVTTWFFGLYQLSFFWVFVVTFITFVFWKSRVLSFTEHFLRQSELFMHRKRALSQSETAEWLNFIINRWYVHDCFCVCPFSLSENNSYNFAFSALDIVGFGIVRGREHLFP